MLFARCAKGGVKDCPNGPVKYFNRIIITNINLLIKNSSCKTTAIIIELSHWHPLEAFSIKNLTILLVRRTAKNNNSIFVVNKLMAISSIDHVRKRRKGVRYQVKGLTRRTRATNNTPTNHHSVPVKQSSRYISTRSGHFGLNKRPLAFSNIKILACTDVKPAVSPKGINSWSPTCLAHHRCW